MFGSRRLATNVKPKDLQSHQSSQGEGVRYGEMIRMNDK